MSTFLKLAFDMPWQVPASCAAAAFTFGLVLWEAMQPYEPPTDTDKPYDWSTDE